MGYYNEILAVLKPFIKIYHRPEVFGLENLPPEGKGFILAPNHSNWFGWDGIVVSSTMPERRVRWLAWSYGNEYPLWDLQVRAFDGILHNNTRKFPYEELSRDVLAQGDGVGIFPEGNNNPINKRYRLRKLFPGCVRLAAMSGAPIIPVSVAGVEEASPVFYMKEVEKAPPALLIPFPGLLPSKVTVRFGEPWTPDVDPDNLNDAEALETACETLRGKILELLKKDKPNAYAE